MGKQNAKCGSMNRCANFVQNAELSSETKDYLVCLGMLEDLSDKMHALLVRDMGEENFNEDWNKWREATEHVSSFIMDGFKEKLVASIGDLHSKTL